VSETEAKPLADGEMPKDFLDCTHPRMFCPMHGEPFRESWPKGGMIFQLMAMKEVIGTPEWNREYDVLVPPPLVKPDPPPPPNYRAMEKLLDKRPVCCRLPPDRLLAIMLEAMTTAKVGVSARCLHCNRQRLGSPYRNFDLRTGTTRTIKHLCLHCVVYSIAPAVS